MSPLLLSVLLPSVALADPIPGIAHSRSRARRLDCERVSTEAATRLYPGRIVATDPESDDTQRSVVMCTERLARPGLRPVRDEAILSTLQERTSELAIAAASHRPELEARTWLVEAYYPSGPVAAKIAFATKNALMGQGLQVSDRTPTLAAGDVDVLTRLDPREAYPAACQRYLATGSLGDEDTLLAVISLDRRETLLHAGLCTHEGWEWLQ